MKHLIAPLALLLPLLAACDSKPTAPTEKRAELWRGASIVRPAAGEKNWARSMGEI